MPGRRMILLLVMLLLTLSVLSATRDISRRTPSERGASSGAAQQTTAPAKPEAEPAPPATPAASAAGNTVAAQLPARRPVRVSLGERVTLRVKSDRPEIAVIEPLGLRAPVGPDTAGVLDFVAGDRGEFPVTLGLEGRRIGEIVVGN